MRSNACINTIDANASILSMQPKTPCKQEANRPIVSQPFNHPPNHLVIRSVSQSDRPTQRRTDQQTVGQTNRQSDRPTDSRTDQQTVGQTNRQTDRPTNRLLDTLTPTRHTHTTSTHIESPSPPFIHTFTYAARIHPPYTHTFHTAQNHIDL